jgi:tRNA (guanine37-N1)-methyltransferase
LSHSILKRAAEKGLARYGVHSIRDHGLGKWRSVDDTPYGGGEGMVLRADVMAAAWRAAVGKKKAHTILLSPQGPVWTQERARKLSRSKKPIVLVCGHYEGIDERFIEECVDEEVSIGDYVLTGGELPALVLADSMVRLIPGVIGNERSVTEDSLWSGLLKYPQFTKPREWEGKGIPEVLLSGDHAKIEKWRSSERERVTRKKRPDLVK